MSRPPIWLRWVLRIALTAAFAAFAALHLTRLVVITAVNEIFPWTLWADPYLYLAEDFVYTGRKWVFAGLILFMGISLVMTMAVKKLEDRLSRWRPEQVKTF